MQDLSQEAVASSVEDRIVVTEQIGKVFRDFWHRPKVEAVRGLDFVLNRGEVFGLLGPNGSGKSTTLKMLLGLLHPTTGSVRIFGRKPTDVSVRKRIGYLPELSWLHRYLNPVETLDYYGALFSLPVAERRRRTGELLRMVGLESDSRRPIGEFSKGMARRIALAQSLINDPELIVLDEPTSGLDPIGCRQVKDLIGALAAQGRTILMSSHLLADVADVCDRIGILHRGTMLAEGRVDDLLRVETDIRLRIEVENAQEAASLRDALQQHTSRPVRIERPSISLERFFLDTVEGARREEGLSQRMAPFLDQTGRRRPTAGATP